MKTFMPRLLICALALVAAQTTSAAHLRPAPANNPRTLTMARGHGRNLHMGLMTARSTAVQARALSHRRTALMTARVLSHHRTVPMTARGALPLKKEARLAAAV